MNLIASCPCGARFSARPDLAGKFVPCPTCGQQFRVPDALIPENGILQQLPQQFQTDYSTPSHLPHPSPRRARKQSTLKPATLIKYGLIAIGAMMAIGFIGLVIVLVIAIPRFRVDAVAGLSSTSVGEQTLLEARKGFVTKIVRSGEAYGAPDSPVGSSFNLIHYQSPVGPLAAYVTTDPGDGVKHPAIVWITGGDNNSIGDVWSPNERSNDQSASAFRHAGIVMMFPSQRGGNDNPGRREGFYGEVDDILAATDHLAALPYVDPDRIYLGGHSTGGTMVMLVGACSDRYRAIFAMGPVAGAAQYGGEYVYCSLRNEKELLLRSPLMWLHCVKSPMFVFEGTKNGNWAAIQMMADTNSNPKIQFFRVPGHDHFTVIGPLAEKLADEIVKGQVNVTQQMVRGLR